MVNSFSEFWLLLLLFFSFTLKLSLFSISSLICMHIKNIILHLGYLHTIRDSLSCRHEKISSVLICCITLHFRDRLGAVSPHYRNRTEIIVLMCERKPYPEYGFRTGAKDIRYNVNIV